MYILSASSIVARRRNYGFQSRETLEVLSLCCVLYRTEVYTYESVVYYHFAVVVVLFVFAAVVL